VKNNQQGRHGLGKKKGSSRSLFPLAKDQEGKTDQLDFGDSLGAAEGPKQIFPAALSRWKKRRWTFLKKGMHQSVPPRVLRMRKESQSKEGGGNRRQKAKRTVTKNLTSDRRKW